MRDVVGAELMHTVAGKSHMKQLAGEVTRIALWLIDYQSSPAYNDPPLVMWTIHSTYRYVFRQPSNRVTSPKQSSFQFISLVLNLFQGHLWTKVFKILVIGRIW